MKYLKLLRTKNYIKNMMLFLPLLFSKDLFDLKNLSDMVFSMISFSALSSVVYIINDLCDKERDQIHPHKSKRPIPSGEISSETAIKIILVLLLTSVLTNYFVSGFDSISWLLLGIYFVQNILYSVKLKQIPILDIVIISAGFIIRVFYGSCIFDIELSKWMYLTVLVASFYLGFSKRRKELEIVKSDSTRNVLNFYNYDFLDKNMYVCSALTIIFYSLWCIDNSSATDINKELLIWTVPLVILICIMYNYSIEKSQKDDIVDILFENKTLLALIVIYGFIMIGIIYWP